MKQFWPVFLIQLKNKLGLSSLKYLYKNNKTKFFRQFMFLPLILLALSPLFMVIIKLYDLIFKIAQGVGQGSLLLTLAFTFTQSMALIFGFFYMMSHFYFARDTEMLIPLPIKPWMILGSKFLLVVLSEYLVVFPLVLPALYIYQKGAGISLLFWLPAALVCLLLPIIPLALSSIFVVLMMRVTNVSNGRGFMRIAGALTGILFYSAIQWSQYRFRNNTPNDLYGMLIGPDSLANRIAHKFPPSLWASRGLSQLPNSEGFAYLGLFLAVCILAVGLLLLMANRFFFKGLIGGEEVSAKKRKRTISKTSYQSHSVGKTLFLREWRTLIRSASFITPVLVNLIIIPVALAVPLITTGKQIAPFLGSLQKAPEFGYFIILASAALITWIGSSNSLAASSISREGQTFWISKILPLSPFSQVLAKLKLAMMIPLVLTAIITIGELYFFRFTFSLAMAQILLSLICSFSANCLALSFDLVKPKLNWSDPQHVMKRNFSVVLSSFSIPGLIGLSGWGIYLLISKTALKPFQIFGMTAGIWILAGLGLLYFIYKTSDHYYQKTEV